MTAQSNDSKEPRADKWAQLRAPFPPEAIRKKPQPLHKNADKHRCDDCGKVHGLPAIHIDYVGHAYVTARILENDPAYRFDAVAHDEHGLPVFLRGEGTLKLYAEMTIFGVTHRDFGEGSDEKACWSDAFKRTAMRHGIAVELWQKEVNSEENAVEPEPEDTYGTCPLCGVGEIVKRKKRDGEIYAKCSLGKYRDKSTCQWVDWSPDFDAHEQRAASGEGVTATQPVIPPARANGTTRPASTQPAPQPVTAGAEQTGKLPWDDE